MEELDFSKLSKNEIIKHCNESEYYKNKFCEFFCRKINNDILNFFAQHNDINELFIHVISNNDKDDFDYVIDLDKDNLSQYLCIQLTFKSINNMVDNNMIDNKI